MNPAEIIQNSSFSAVVISDAVIAFSKRDDKGMPFILACTILPLVLNHQACRQINSRRGDGAFYRVVEETPKISAGLEDRIRSMLPQTFDALNMAIAADCIFFSANSQNLTGGPRHYPDSTRSLDLREKTRAAKKLGNWFAIVEAPQVCALLNLRM